jgi:cytidyltransferase-like protein
MAQLTVSGSFDDLRASNIRYLEDLGNRGQVHVQLWSDALIRSLDGKDPKFPEGERKYFLEAIRYVDTVELVDDPKPVSEGMSRRPGSSVEESASSGHTLRPRLENAKKVIVTGCYDWLHTGHVRFFEEVAEYGDVYAVVGNDANVAALKGAGHPQIPEDERRFVVGSLKFVKQALVATGSGWLDAEPEIERIKPDIYAVNEDGDKPQKREYCQQHGIEYLVLKRLPKPGLPRRSSTDLRGF